MTPTLRVCRLDPRAVLPRRSHPEDAGYDLTAIEEAVIDPGKMATLPTGLAVTVPKGTYGRVAPRSGLASKKGIDILGGVVDRGYTGEVMVIVINNGTVPFVVVPGDRIAQLVLESIVLADVEEVEELDPTVRGTGGLGSTGIAGSP